MADDEKVYTNEEITDNPFPDEISQETTESNSSSGSGQATYTNEAIPDTPIPRRRIAQELISASLNTKTQKILAEYEFERRGAIVIGDYQSEKQGEIRISPEGIYARNKVGLTTFAIDGETGDATFRGTVQAGEFQVIDEYGLVSLTQFQSDFTSNVNAYSTNSDTDVDITNVTLNLIVDRPARILFFCSTQGKNWDVYAGCSMIVKMKLDNTQIGGLIYLPGVPFAIGDPDEGVAFNTGSMISVSEVEAGDHVLKLTYARQLGGTAVTQNNTLGYIVLGK